MKLKSVEITPKKPATILILDDEEMVTITLATYLELETDYLLVVFQSPSEALAYLKKHPVDLVITDFLMPDMDGLHFLAEAQKLYPDLTSIMLTGYADKENAIKAINEVNLFQYVEKPWDNENIKILIRNALQYITLERILGKKIVELNGVLLERAKLLQQNEMMREELQLAKNVQQSMLPNEFPNSDNVTFVASYQPALEIGGDFYDVIPLAGNKLGIMIADVTGHGIQAALITVLLKSAFADWREKKIGPSEILSAFNRLLFRILPKNIYAAGQVLVFNPATYECKLANGGIPHPFVIKKKSGEVQRITANGLLLGIADESVFVPGEELAFCLEPGDKLLLYTDGLSEIECRNGSHFDRSMASILQKIIEQPVDQILKHLEKKAKKLSKPEHHWDDVTMLGIEIK